jgi:hypothetical protein
VKTALDIKNNIQESPDGIIELDFPLIASGQKLKAKVVFWQPVNPGQSKEDIAGLDIAGLQIEETLPMGVSPIKLVTTSDYWQHKFRIFGFPQGHDTGVWADGELRDVQANSWIQIEAIKVTGYQIERGFSGSPIWDETLQGVVGMAVAAEKKREGVKAAFMIPTTVLVEAWSFLNLINILTTNSDSAITSAIQTAYQTGCSQNPAEKIPTTIEAIVQDLYDLDKINLDRNEKFNHNHYTAKFIKSLITNSQIPQPSLEELKKWGSNNIEDFDKLIQDVNKQDRKADIKESYILVKIEQLTTKSRSKIPKFKISGGVIPNIQNYIKHQTGFYPINFSDSPDDSFTLKKIEEELFVSLFQKIPWNCKLESQIKFVFFLPPQYLNHPVEEWKINDSEEIIVVGNRYSVIVRDVKRLNINYINVKQSYWINKWEKLENITCNNFQKLYEYDEKRFSLLMHDAIGVILNLFDENNQNDNSKITNIFIALRSNAVPIAICHRDKRTLEQEEYENKANDELNCYTYELPDHVMKQRIDFLLYNKKHLLGNNVFIIYENPHILPFKPEPIIINEV